MANEVLKGQLRTQSGLKKCYFDSDKFWLSGYGLIGLRVCIFY